MEKKNKSKFCKTSRFKSDLSYVNLAPILMLVCLQMYICKHITTFKISIVGIQKYIIYYIILQYEAEITTRDQIMLSTVFIVLTLKSSNMFPCVDDGD